jgi:RNA polymerase sigma-70 factor (ECF subfamily)
MTDQERVEAILQGNVALFEEIIRDYEKKIFRMAYSFCFHRETAEDWTQEIFMRAFKNLSSYNPQYPFCSWFLCLSTNYLINQRKKKRLSLLPWEPEQIQELPLTPKDEEVLAIPQFEARLESALVELKPKYEQVFRLYHLQNRSYQEIATLLKKPINTIKTHLFRARSDLRDKLKPYLESPP